MVSLSLSGNVLCVKQHLFGLCEASHFGNVRCNKTTISLRNTSCLGDVICNKTTISHLQYIMFRRCNMQSKTISHLQYIMFRRCDMQETNNILLWYKNKQQSFHLCEVQMETVIISPCEVYMQKQSSSQLCEDKWKQMVVDAFMNLSWHSVQVRWCMRVSECG